MPFHLLLTYLAFCCASLILAVIPPAHARSVETAALTPASRAAAAAAGYGLTGSGRLNSHSRSNYLPSRPSSLTDLTLSDTVVLTSVEGGLYAVDRQSGHRLWSLPPHAGHQSDSLLRPLVTALYGKDQRSFAEIASSFSSKLGLGSMPELEAGGIYIVEPSSAGDIYVLTPSTSDDDVAAFDAGPNGRVKLDKLPLTLPQLVELSPFSFAGDDTRVFVGQKQTTLVELDVRTGQLGAVFGGRAGGIWCGAQANEPASSSEGKSADSEACIDDENAFGATSQASHWAYVGRTDYTLNIHARNSPDLLQTLHFSTFTPNAGDRDIQSIWYRANHPDGRAIMGMPEDGSVVCFNLTEAEQPANGNEDSSKTLWSTQLEASVAGIFDVVYPAPHLQNSKSMSRPILVSHPPVPISRLFPQIASGGSASGGGIPSLGSGSESRTHRSTYLGIAGDSLFAMGSNRFPLVAFASKAVSSLPDGQDHSHNGFASPLPPSQGDWANERKCASFGCWLGSYDVTVDSSMEGALQESLLPSRPLLEIGDGRGGRPPLAIGDSSSSGNDSSPNDYEEEEEHNDEDRSWESPSNSPRKSNASPRRTPESTKPKRRDPIDDEEPSPSAQVRPWKSRLAIGLLQLIGLLLIGLLTGAVYLGLEQQKAQSETQAATIAKGVVWVPAFKEDEAGFSIDREKIDREEAKQLQEAIEESKKALAKAGASSSNNDANTKVNGNANGSVEGANGQVEEGSGIAKKKANKRRRRGKRAGAAAAAKAAKAAKAEGDDEEGDEDDDDDEEAGEGTDRRTSSNGAPSRARSGSQSTLAEANETPRKKPSHASTGSSGSAGSEIRHSAISAIKLPSKNSPQITQALMSPNTNSPRLEAGWPSVNADLNADTDGDAVKAAGEEASRIAMGATVASATDGMKASSLTISDEVLGYGSSGTVVFKGTFQGRAVAVKRLLRDFVNVASKEVSLLESADNHPNVIRYFYKELTPSFLLIALELCPASLAEVVEKPNDFRDLSVLLDPKRALRQISSGLRHLHSLSIVHRDIKPQNILVSLSSNGRALKMLLSDFGLSKKLDSVAQTSFSQTMNNPGGTVGWRAPEILRGDVNLDAGSESESSLGNASSSSSSSSPNGGKEEKQRLTRAVDIFALGCLAYYVLSNGDHPFGSRFEREMNIIRKRVDTSRLDGLGEEGHEAQDLVLQMVEHDPRQRPSASEILTHPYFWDANKRLNFLQDASDRFEIMEKDPPSPALVILESKAMQVVGTDWHRRCDKAFLENLGKFRKYDPGSVQDLLRAMRNKKHHYQDMPPHLKRMLGPIPDGFLAYFTRRFPELFLHVHRVIVEQPLIRSEPMFREYFVCADQDH